MAAVVIIVKALNAYVVMMTGLHSKEEGRPEIGSSAGLHHCSTQWEEFGNHTEAEFNMRFHRRESAYRGQLASHRGVTLWRRRRRRRRRWQLLQDLCSSSSRQGFLSLSHLVTAVNNGGRTCSRLQAVKWLCSHGDKGERVREREKERSNFPCNCRSKRWPSRGNVLLWLYREVLMIGRQRQCKASFFLITVNKWVNVLLLK